LRRHRLKLTVAGASCAVLGLSAVLVPAPALARPSTYSVHDAPSGHHHPSASSVRASKAAVTRLEQQVTRAANELGRAQSRLDKLNTTAEVAFEAYDGARVKLHAAQQAASTAADVLGSANKLVDKGQRNVAEFARAAYETGGLSTIDALLSADGPGSISSRLGDLEAISNDRDLTLQRFTASQVYQTAVSRQADAEAGKAHRAEVAAATAKSAAQAEVARQQSLLGSLRTKRSRLNTLLADARAHASKLQREHLQALAQARAAAAAAASPPASTHSAPSPYAGASGSTAGTISAATGQAAVNVAEQQIGKPYQWGGAGPSTFDCSGLVMWSYDQVGVHLDHWTGDQWNEGAHISTGELRPGDLLFFAYNTSDPSTIHHVGMYIGNGEMVQAPYTGADVEITSDSRPDYIGAVRPYQR
jgi:cell wall-associated NlpC family hydrolase